MLEEEKNTEFEDFDEDDNIVNINNITHPAIDINTKWVLETLFKNNINLPF